MLSEMMATLENRSGTFGRKIVYGQRKKKKKKPRHKNCKNAFFASRSDSKIYRLKNIFT